MSSFMFFYYVVQRILVWALLITCFPQINNSNSSSSPSRIGKVEGLYNNNILIRVCQNKHCCKRNKDIFQTINNLVGNNIVVDEEGKQQQIIIEVESSGCLSQCDLGPNIEVTTGDKETTTTTLPTTKTILNGMVNAQTIAFQLGELSTTTTSSSSFPPLPKIMIAASKVIEMSEQFAANGRHDEQIKYLTSVINKLENSLSSSSSSSSSSSLTTAANAHAHALRAQGYLQQQQASLDDDDDDDKVTSAIHDAQKVVRDLSAVATPLSLSLAFRAWTDAELIIATNKQQQQQQQHHQKGEQIDVSKAVAVLSQWHQTQPIYRTKLKREIEGLLLS